MANTINNMKDAPGVIAKMAAQMLADKTQFAKSIDKEDVSAFDGKNGYQAGDTIQISKPARFVPSSDADVTSAIQDIVEEKTSLTLDTRKVVPIKLNSAEIFTELGLKQWTKRVLDPAISSIANYVESSFLDKAVDSVFNNVSTSTFDQDAMLAAGQKLYENGCTDEDYNFALLNPYATRKAVTGRADLQNAPEEISKQYKRGVMGLADGFTYLRNNHLPTHTNGNDVTGLAVDDTVSEGDSTINIDGFTATTGTITKGTVFTIDGVFAVHPITKATLSDLQQFVVTSDGTADGNGDIDVAIYPALYAGSNGLQNISALPANDATITVVGAADGGYAQNLVYNRNAFRMVSVPLMLPDDAHMAAQETVDGLTVRVWMASDIMTDNMIARVDFLGGLAAVRPEWACRVGPSS